MRFWKFFIFFLLSINKAKKSKIFANVMLLLLVVFFVKSCPVSKCVYLWIHFQNSTNFHWYNTQHCLQNQMTDWRLHVCMCLCVQHVLHTHTWKRLFFPIGIFLNSSEVFEVVFKRLKCGTEQTNEQKKLSVIFTATIKLKFDFVQLEISWMQSLYFPNTLEKWKNDF